MNSIEHLQSILDTNWPRILSAISNRRPLILSWVEIALPSIPSYGTLLLRFPKEHALAIDSLAKGANRLLLDEIIHDVLGDQWQLQFEQITRSSSLHPDHPSHWEDPILPHYMFKADGLPPLEQQSRCPPSLLKACQDVFDYALKLSTGEVIRFDSAEIHGDYATLFGSVESNTSLDGKKQGLPFVFDRGLDVRIANIIWCADAPEGS